MAHSLSVRLYRVVVSGWTELVGGLARDVHSNVSFRQRFSYHTGGHFRYDDLALFVFWQTSEEVEEEIANGHKRLWQRRGATDSELQYAAWDVNIGMFFSNVVMYFIIFATAATLHKTGQTAINTAADAAIALRPLAGNAAYILMALGLIGTGFLAVPILTTSGAYAVCETFGWRWGLDRKLRGARHFYFVIAASTIVALLINFIGINPIDALFWTAVINGFLAPPLLVVIMLIANNKKVMGDRVNGLGLNIAGWATATIMFAAAIGIFVS